jgi:hypothetical protein
MMVYLNLPDQHWQRFDSDAAWVSVLQRRFLASTHFIAPQQLQTARVGPQDNFA